MQTLSLGSRPILLLLLSLSIMLFCDSFTLVRPHRTTTTSAAHKQRISITTLQSSSIKEAESNASWINLPTRSAQVQQQQQQEQFKDDLIRLADQTELVLGRLAMVAATLLLCKEVFTGESFFDQVAEAVASLPLH